MVRAAEGDERLHIRTTQLADIGRLVATLGEDALYEVSTCGSLAAGARGGKVVVATLREEALVPQVLRLEEAQGVVTCLSWVPAELGMLLVAGTSAGVTLLVSSCGLLLHLQRFRPRAVSRVRCFGEAAEAEVGVLHADGVVVVINPASLRHLQRCPPSDRPPPSYHPVQGGAVDLTEPARAGSAPPPIPVWSVSPWYLASGVSCTAYAIRPGTDGVFASRRPEAGGVLDFALVPDIQSSALSVYSSAPVRCIVAVGEQPSIAAFRAIAEVAVPSMRAIAGKVAKLAVGAVRASLWKDEPGSPSSRGRRPPAPPSGGFVACPRPVGLQTVFHFRDPEREVRSVTMDGSRRLLAAVDSLQRVCIVDTAAFAVCRMITGVRDAQVAWLRCPTGGEDLLLVYTPQRGAAEVWRPRAAVRVGAAIVGKRCRVLQGRGSCYLLRPDGTLAQLLVGPRDNSARQAAAAARLEARQEEERRLRDAQFLEGFREACARAQRQLMSQLLATVDDPRLVLQCVALAPEPASGSPADCATAAEQWYAAAAAALERLEALCPPGGQEEGSVEAAEGQDEVAVASTSASRAATYLRNRLAVLRGYLLLVSPAAVSPVPGHGGGREKGEAPGDGAWPANLACLDPVLGATLPVASVLEDPDPGPAPVRRAAPGEFLAVFSLLGAEVSARSSGDARLQRLLRARLSEASTPEEALAAVQAVTRAVHCLRLPPRAVLRALIRGTSRGVAMFKSAPPNTVGRLFNEALQSGGAAEVLREAEGRGGSGVAILAVAGAASLGEVSEEVLGTAGELMKFRELLAEAAKGLGIAPAWMSTFRCSDLFAGVSPATVLAAAAAPAQVPFPRDQPPAPIPQAAFAEALGVGLRYRAHCCLLLASVMQSCLWEGEQALAQPAVGWQGLAVGAAEQL
eukprot:Hpha_TRINITY_DN16765_c0_g5::TRINITY_DN16765_c0_g5_i1::g.80575::m.80575